jgi:hypothetical protein
MSESLGLQDIVAHATRSICVALHRHGIDERVCLALKSGLQNGSVSVVEKVVAVVADQLDDEPQLREALNQSLPRAARVFAAMLATDSPTSELLLEAAETLEMLGDCATAMDAPDMAYNLYEVSSGCGAPIDRAALRVATLLRELADPKNVDQLGAAAWRYATERLRASLDQQSDWMEAIDAVETALTVWVSQPVHQAQLYEPLERVLLHHAENTPLAGLTAIVPTQAPPHALALERRLQFSNVVLGQQAPTAPVGVSRQRTAEAVAFLASVKAQAVIDDLRLKLGGGVPPSDTSMTWHDLSLEHRGLISAVPLGRALVADPERTGELVLELVHEITHAYCLLGPIGWAHRAYRAGISYLEMLMAHGSAAPTWPNAMPTLPAAAALLAQRQLATLLRSEMLVAVWTPWLEGVAVYMELLCDPKDDPNEINLPFTAVRSLIDFPSLERRPSETDDELHERYGDHVAAEFEAFYSSVCRRKSRVRHLAYLRQDDEGTIYLTGYLLVRSIVARWEHTLGHRLSPVRAAKLLLDATRNGSMAAIPPLDTPLEEFIDACYERMASWLQRIADLDRESLSTFLQSVRRHEGSRMTSWLTGRPQTVEPDSTVEIEEFTRQYEALRDGAAQWIFGEPAPADPEDRLAQHYAAYRDLCEVQNRLAGILPVGRDYARLLLGADGRTTVCPRTYAGIIPPTADNAGQLADPRYSVASFFLQDPGQLPELRRLCAVLETSRVLVTRVVDLVGNRRMPAGSSYVYLGLDTAWNHIRLGYVGQELGEEWEDINDLIAARVNAGALTGDEATTLASLQFLAQRYEGVAPASGLAESARGFDRTEYARTVGLSACALAFSADPELVEKCFEATTPEQLNQLAQYLHKTGWDEAGDLDIGEATLASIVASTESYSGVIPFGGPV